MAADSILTTVRQFLEIDPTVQVVLEPIQKGASGRTIVRVKTAGREPFIGMHWTDERPENDRFAEVARFLRKAGLKVPAILHENAKWRVLLLEDLGGSDLLSLKDRPFEEREPFYRSAFRQLDKLLYARAPKELELCPPFDEATYRWEQDYFFEHCVEGLWGLDASPLRQAEAFRQLAAGLGASAKNLVHRDFQSQNLMLREDEVWWVDFQGMRRGRQEYDLASLIFDPYLDHSAADRERLLDLWEDVTEERPADRIFRECAAQRLMQALGAYGFIVKVYKNDWYRQHVPTATRLLREVIAGLSIESLLAPVLERGLEVPAAAPTA